MPKSILKYLALVCLLYGNISNAQTFPPFNLALDDSCAHAPFFCEGALAVLSTNNQIGTPNGLDSLTGCTMENTVWLSFTTCLDSVQLDFMVDSCSLGNGLEFSLFDTDDCLNYTLIGAPCRTIIDQTTSSLNFNNLTAGQTYTLAIDGIGGDFCSFAIDTTIGIYAPTIGTAPDSEFEWITIEEAYIIPPPENCPSGAYEYIPPVCILQPSNCSGSGPGMTTCDIEYNLCKPDPGTYIYPSFLYDTIISWYYPDCAIVTGDTTGYNVNIDISECVTELIESMFQDSILPPTPPHDPLLPVATFNFNYGVNVNITATLDSNNIDTVVITEGGITHCIGCGTPSSICGDCIGDVNTDGESPIYYCQEDKEVCPECSDGHCPGDFSWEINGCKINAELYIPTDPQDEYLGPFVVCEGECLFLEGFQFCGQGFHSFPSTDDDGCEIEKSLEIIEEYPPFIISTSGNNILTCDQPCVTLQVDAIDAFLYQWSDGSAGFLPTITVCNPGSYSCEVSNSCGFDFVTFTVQEDIMVPTIDSISASISAITVGLDSSELTVSYSGNGANFTFSWIDNIGFQFGTTPSVIVTEPGVYEVVVTDQNNGCSSQASIEIFENIIQQDRLAIGSDCETAPLFCADFLIDVDTDNSNGEADSSLIDLDCPVENAVWLKFVACDSTASFSFEVDSCNQAQGLEFSIVSSSDCNNYSSIGSNCIPVLQGSLDSISFDSLSADSVYYLVIDGIDGDICNLNIDALNGVMNSPYGDTLDPIDTTNYVLEQIIPGSIQGPTEICAFAPSTFTFDPGVCALVEGDCNRAADPNSARVFAEPCDLPFNLCFNDIQTDTIVDWDIPAGIDIIGDSTDFEITIEPSLDWVLDLYNGMIPASDTDTVVITLYADYSIVPINDTATSDSTEVYCHCPATSLFCGSCSTGASLDVTVIIIFNSQTISQCDPDCIQICSGQLLCPGGSAYCTAPCVLTTWNLIEEPPQIDFYQETVCPGDCAQTPYGEFCPGSYSVEIDSCLTVQIEIDEQLTNIVYPEEFICPGECVDVGSMTFCAAGFETWTEMVNGCPVNYSVTILEYNTTPVDYGIVVLCESECLDISGFTFCTPGVHDFVETSPDGCAIQATVELIWQSSSLSIGPVTEVCNAAGDQFNISFSIFGDAPFTVNGVEITGNFFTSDYYDDGDSYFFEIKNSQGICPSTQFVVGTYFCPLTICDNEPGQLNIKDENHCSSSTLVVEEVSPVIIGVNDFTFEYVLHEGVDPFSNTILQRNQSGIFTFDNALVYNVEYTVSRIIGERVSGTSMVNIANGDCLKYTEGPTVTFYEDPVLIMNPVGNLKLDCNQSEILLTAETSGGSSQLTTQWTINGTVGVGNAVTIDQSGTILIELFDNLTGCNVQEMVEVTADFAQPIFTLEDPEILDCLVDEVEIVANVDDMGNQLQLEWSGPLGNLPLNSNPLVVNTNEPGWHYLSILNEENGCASVDSVLVLKNQNLVENYDLVVDQPICADDPMGSMNISNIQGGTAPYDYYLNGMTFFGEMENLSPGVYELELIDQNGCVVLDEFEIIEPIALQSNLTSEITVDYGEEILLDPNLNFSPLSITWSDAQSKVLGNDELLNITLEETQSINLTATDENGCIIEQKILVKVKQPEDDIYAPSAFSPNGDQVNDFYELFATQQVTNIDKLMIFDRWGNLVFQAENYLPGDDIGKWNGTFKGKKLNPAVFIYSAQYTLVNGKEISKTGDLVLLR